MNGNDLRELKQDLKDWVTTKSLNYQYVETLLDKYDLEEGAENLDFLQNLMVAGVDSWSGYEYAQGL